MDTAKPARKQWIDMARGLCMMAILFFHTEMYYAGHDIIPYVVYVENALIIFFFLSGYLFYKEGKTFSPVYKLKAVVRSLVLPYFIFTALLALPKHLFHHTPVSLQTLTDILTGQASWFVATLITAELIFSLLLWITKGKTAVLSTLCCAAFFLMALLNAFYPDFHHYPPYLWHWTNALLFLIFIYLGYLYHLKEKVIHTASSYILLFLILLWIIMKYMECRNGVFLTAEPIHISSYTLLLADGCLSAYIVVSLCKKMRPIGMVCWTGCHSLVYYFICGAVPTLVSFVLNKTGYGYEGQYYRVVTAFIAVYLIATAITWFIYRYLPFMAGQKKGN